MAKFDGFNAEQFKEIEKIYKSTRVALEKAANDIDSTQFRTRFAEYMGTTGGLDAIKAGEKSLAATIRVMHARIATLSFTVRYEAAMADNADMWGFTGAAMTPQDTLDLVDSYRSGSQNVVDAGVVRVSGGKMVMRIGSNVWGMPYTSTTEQSQVETFMHELSHHAAGTIDDKNGGECYGLIGVTRLKNLGPARAVRNAENVGFFCVTYA